VKEGNLMGYIGVGPNKGKAVVVDDAFHYVCEQVGIVDFDPSAPDAEEFQENLIDWYFSGNWVEVREDG
jgi:hypothetical protein